MGLETIRLIKCDGMSKKHPEKLTRPAPDAPPAQAPAPGRECWVLFHGPTPTEALPNHIQFPLAQPGTTWVRMVESKSEFRARGGPEAPETADPLREAVEAMKQAGPSALAMFRRLGIVFKGEGGGWEKIAFTLYTELAQLSQIAEAALEAAPASVKPKAEPSPNLDLYRDENKHITRFKKETP